MAQSVRDAPISSPRQSRLIDRTPFFFGWVVLLAGSISSVMMGPSQTFTVGLFTDSYETDLGLTRATVSLLYGLATLGASLMLPITGRLVDRYGSHKMLIIVTAAFAVSCASMSLAVGAVTLLITLLVLRFLGYGSTLLVSNNAIAQWFIRRRGMVMGLAGQALAISLLFWPALTDYLIQSYSWRFAWIGISLIVLLVSLPVAWLLIRDRPELYGQQPDGGRHLDSLYPVVTSEENWTLNEAMHTGIFWVFFIAFFLLSTIFAGVVFHQASIFETQGVSRQVAVSAFQAMAIVSIIGNLAMGWLLDKVSARILLVALLAAMSASVWFLQHMQTPMSGFIYAAFIGFSLGGFRVMDATVWAKYFGRLHLGSIRGVTMVGTLGGTAFGALPLGLSYDLTGSYAPVLSVFMLLPLGVYVMLIFVKRPSKHPDTADALM